MRYVRMTVIAAVAALAVAAFVSAAASAAEPGYFCDTATDPCTSKWALNTVADFSLVAGGSSKLESTAGSNLNTCTSSTLKFKLTSNSGEEASATGENTETTWGGGSTPCNPYSTTTSTLGKLRVKAEDDSGNAIVYADSEIEWTVSVPGFLGGPCIYKIPSGREIGTFKESTQRWIVNAIVDRTQTGTHPCIFGTGTNKWTAEYALTEPSETTLYVSTKA